MPNDTATKQTSILFTRTDARPASKAPASKPSQKPSASKPEPTIVEKGLKSAGLEGAAREARKGAQEAERAIKKQPTPERKAVVAVVKAGEASVKTTATAAGEVAKPVVKAAKKHGDRVNAPMHRETAEASKEAKSAVKGVDKAGSNSVSELREETSAAWRKQPTIERKVVVSGAEVVENAVQGGVRTVGAVGKLGKETVEGVAEVAVNNPAVEHAKIAGSAVVGGVRGIGSAVFGFGEARVEDGAKAASKGASKGASSAAQKASSTWKEIRDRDNAQAAENRKEIRDAGKTFGEGFKRSLKPFADDEVRSAWKNQPTIERRIAIAGWETGETIVQDFGSTFGNLGNITKEAGEGVVENTITGARNVGTAVTGGAKAVGGFVGGLFGG